MGITNSNKEISVQKIKCQESFKVKLSLTAAPDIRTNPKDIVLALDNSGSMKGAPLEALKRSAKRFVDIIDEATDEKKDGTIANGSHIGIVQFSTNATIALPLSTNVAELKTAIDGLTSDDLTNHTDAFEKAMDVLDMTSKNEKIIVMFTDGTTTAGGNAEPIATSIKQQGVTIYCIGLGPGSSTYNGLQALKSWATDPDSTHVLLSPTNEDLDETFDKLAVNITTPGATNIVIKDTLNPCFKIESFDPTSTGTASIVDDHNIQWDIPQLGVLVSESATLSFNVKHIGPCSGTIAVNNAIDYKDTEGNMVTFPNPTIEVVCGEEIIAEACPESEEIVANSCDDYVSYDASDVKLTSLGRVLDLNVKLKNICPNKKVALAVYLTEVDLEGVEHDRGIKFISVPAHKQATCQDILVRCIKFILPEDNDMVGSNNSLCDTRTFKARFLAHYADTDVNFDCCNQN